VPGIGTSHPSGSRVARWAVPQPLVLAPKPRQLLAIGLGQCSRRPLPVFDLGPPDPLSQRRHLDLTEKSCHTIERLLSIDISGPRRSTPYVPTQRLLDPESSSEMTGLFLALLLPAMWGGVATSCCSVSCVPGR